MKMYTSYKRTNLKLAVYANGFLNYEFHWNKLNVFETITLAELLYYPSNKYINVNMSY